MGLEYSYTGTRVLEYVYFGARKSETFSSVYRHDDKLSIVFITIFVLAAIHIYIWFSTPVIAVAADPALSGSDSEEVVGVDVPSPPETQSSRLASSRDTSARVRFCCCTNSFDAKRCTPSSAIQYRPRVIPPVTDNKKMIGSGARNGKSNASSSWSANLRSAVEHHGRC